jgi:hypothetical protein
MPIGTNESQDDLILATDRFTGQVIEKKIFTFSFTPTIGLSRGMCTSNAKLARQSFGSQLRTRISRIHTNCFQRDEISEKLRS